MNSGCAAALRGVLRPAAVACGVRALEEAPALGSPWLFQLRVQVFLPSGLPHRAVLPGALQMLFPPGWSHRSALAALALGLRLVAREERGGGTGQLFPVTQASRNSAANRSLRLACAASGRDAAPLVRLEVSKSSHRLHERPQRARARAGRSRGRAATCQPAGSLLRAPGLVPRQHRAPCPGKAALKLRGCHPQTAAHGHGAAGAAHPAPSCHCCSGNS